MRNDHVVIGVHITDRVKKATEVQKILTAFGCAIKTRLGLHETGEQFCSPNGLLLLEFIGDDSQAADMIGQLAGIEGIDVQKMVFDHP